MELRVYGSGLGVQCYGLRALRLHFGVGALCPMLATAARNNIAGKIAAQEGVLQVGMIQPLQTPV